MDAGQHFVIDRDCIHRIDCSRFVNRTDTGDQIAHMPHFLLCHGMLVLGDGKYTEAVGRILTCGHSEDTFHGLSSRRIDRFDLGIVMG